MSQPIDASVHREQMKKLGFILGQWKGEGWIQIGPGNRTKFKQTENVQLKLDGAVIVAEGAGKGQIGGTGPEVVVHSAIILIAYDGNAQGLRFNIMLRSDGLHLFDATGKVTPAGTVEWGFKEPTGAVNRFTMSQTPKGQWKEVGERSEDGKSWVQFFEMVLDRVTAP